MKNEAKIESRISASVAAIRRTGNDRPADERRRAVVDGQLVVADRTLALGRARRHVLMPRTLVKHDVI